MDPLKSDGDESEDECIQEVDVPSRNKDICILEIGRWKNNDFHIYKFKKMISIKIVLIMKQKLNKTQNFYFSAHNFLKVKYCNSCREEKSLQICFLCVLSIME